MSNKVYLFRALIDYEDDVFRDIEIRADQTFEALHYAIQKAFEFDASQMASFYMSNRNWDKGQEITLMNMMEENDGIPTMDSAKLSDFVKEKHQKILYVFDFLLMWCFYIELIEEKKTEDGAEYPRCTNKYGEAPGQYSKSLDIDKPEGSSNGNGTSGNDIFEDFDDFDQDNDIFS